MIPDDLRDDLRSETFPAEGKLAEGKLDRLEHSAPAKIHGDLNLSIGLWRLGDTSSAPIAILDATVRAVVRGADLVLEMDQLDVPAGNIPLKIQAHFCLPDGSIVMPQTTLIPRRVEDRIVVGPAGGGQVRVLR